MQAGSEIGEFPKWHYLLILQLHRQDKIWLASKALGGLRGEF
jgi:hypothetical protein